MTRFTLSSCLLALTSFGTPPSSGGEAGSDGRPNILWISAEDIGPHLGCYGDEYATTPNLDALAEDGAVFTRCFANAGVCAVARSCLITGMYPVAIGSQHMRSNVVPPPEVKCFPEYLRAAGYYCTNRSKTDYNFPAPPSAWDENGSKHKDWDGRADGQPFFSVINLTVSHESRVRDLALRKKMGEVLGDDRHDPATVPLPPYIPDTPETRADRAQYHDGITRVDREVGRILERLEADGLAEKTIVVFCGDHGEGLPRGKRWLYDSGLHVPLLVRWPGRVRPGTTMTELVSFVDFAPSTLAMCGVAVPQHMQGKVLFGSGRDDPRHYVFAHRDRMDETHDLIRACRDTRYKYIRNFRPGTPRSARLTYRDRGNTMRALRREHAAGTLDDTQSAFFAPTKPAEELYDTKADPHEIKNVAGDPAHAQILERMRKELEEWQVEVGDTGMIPEAVLDVAMRPGGEVQRTEPPAVLAEATGAGRFNVTLDSPTEGASIVYGVRDEPATERLYTGPFAVEPGTTVKALACRLGYRDSTVAEKTIEEDPE